MLRRLLLTVLLAFLLAAGAPAQSGGERDLALGREALARKDYIAALEHLSRATGSLDPERDREKLADAWFDLGLTYLNGLDRPEPALAAFLKSAEGAASPESAWLWASAAAEKLGRTEEAARYKARAIPPTPSPAPEPEPAVESIPAASVEPLRPDPRPEPAAEPEPPKEKPDAFRHFFGGKKKDERTAKPEEKKPEPEVEKKEGEKVDAFEYFFGKKRKEKKEEEKPAEPPPTSPARSPARTG
jgi:tetratricopeptide (TPR) repeat protein